MLQGILRIDLNTNITKFDGLIEVFASEVYLDSNRISEGKNRFSNNIVLLSASKLIISNSSLMNIEQF